MTTIGTSTPSLRYTDRAAYVQRVANSSNGRLTNEQVTVQLEESDRIDAQQAINRQKSANGEGTYLGSWKKGKVVWDPAGYEEALSAAKAARVKPYLHMSGPIKIEAMNVDSALSATSKLTGGDLKNINYYADHLRNEFAAALSVKDDVTFIGSWGKERVTHDVNEYAGWLMQAAQQKSQGVAEALSQI